MLCARGIGIYGDYYTPEDLAPRFTVFSGNPKSAEPCRLAPFPTSVNWRFTQKRPLLGERPFFTAVGFGERNAFQELRGVGKTATCCTKDGL